MQIQQVLEDRLYAVQGVEALPPGTAFRWFQPKGLEYLPFCDDFGPMDMSTVVHFIEQLRDELDCHPDAKLIYSISSDRRALANEIFLLGAYLIIMLQRQTADVMEIFDWLDEADIEHFRDATFVPDSFVLRLDDCWRGLEKAMALAWVQPTTDGEFWGDINILEYRHYANPCNGDFHEVVPRKFIAFAGPKDLGGDEYLDDARRYRSFSPSYYATVFTGDFGVTAVVRLNEPQYDAAAFEERGVRHHHLHFDDCACPPPRVARAFLTAADAVLGDSGAVAVHCKAGLGRTGTLIALYMMRSLGFGAREAMGWLRIMRPGSVIGPQQHFLCALEARPSFAAELGIFGGTQELTPVADTSGKVIEREEEAVVEEEEGRAGGPDSGHGAIDEEEEGLYVGVGGAATVDQLAADVAAGMERRTAARMQRGEFGL
jgi:cell division cycle 14